MQPQRTTPQTERLPAHQCPGAGGGGICACATSASLRVATAAPALARPFNHLSSVRVRKLPRMWAPLLRR